MYVTQHYSEYIRNAKTAEQEGELDEAISLYEKAIKQKPILEFPYARLMVLYRKSKLYKDELRVINKAIEVFTNHYEKRKEKLKHSAQITRLSKALLKSISGKTVQAESSYPQPVNKWIQRKDVVENKN